MILARRSCASGAHHGNETTHAESDRRGVKSGPTSGLPVILPESVKHQADRHDVLLKKAACQVKMALLPGYEKIQNQNVHGQQTSSTSVMIRVGYRAQKFSNNTIWLARCRRLTSIDFPSCVQAARNSGIKSDGN
jgi:hypothetical protein